MSNNLDFGQFLFSTLAGTTISAVMGLATRKKPTQTAGALPADAVPVEITGRTMEDLEFALATIQDAMQDGEKVRIQLLTDTMPAPADLDMFYATALAEGHHISSPTTKVLGDVVATELTIQKGSPALLLLIPLIPTIIVGGLITFGITRLGDITKALMPLILVTIGGIIITAAIVTRKPVVEAVARTKFLR